MIILRRIENATKAKAGVIHVPHNFRLCICYLILFFSCLLVQAIVFIILQFDVNT